MSDAAAGKGETEENGNHSREYRLEGPQAEPLASFFLDRPSLCIPAREKIVAYTKSDHPRLRLEPRFCPDDEALAAEFPILQSLARQRFSHPYPLVKISQLETGALSPLSRFLHLQPQPFGAIFDLKEHPEFKLPNITRQHL
jgi:hypothetical protein